MPAVAAAPEEGTGLKPRRGHLQTQTQNSTWAPQRPVALPVAVVTDDTRGRENRHLLNTAPLQGSPRPPLLRRHSGAQVSEQALVTPRRLRRGLWAPSGPPPEV